MHDAEIVSTDIDEALPSEDKAIAQAALCAPHLVAPEMKASSNTFFRMIIYPFFSVPHQLDAEQDNVCSSYCSIIVLIFPFPGLGCRGYFTGLPYM